MPIGLFPFHHKIVFSKTLAEPSTSDTAIDQFIHCPGVSTSVDCCGDNGLIQVNEERWTRVSESWQGIIIISKRDTFNFNFMIETGKNLLKIAQPVCYKLKGP